MRCKCSIASSSCELFQECPMKVSEDICTDRCRLLFMTYNGWVMLAVAAGAFFGYLGFGNSSPTKSVACH